MAPRERTSLGRYRLLKQLAVGGMAEIYVATAEGLGGFEKQLALKVIHPNFSADPDFVQMLVDEAKLAVQLQHSNIVQTFDLGKIDSTYYIVMELIDGSDLYKIMRKTVDKDTYLPFEAAAHIAHEVATGLDYAHRKRDPDNRPLQIVHRDISPQNILVSHSGEVKIVDFGIAKAARRGREQTAVGVIKGKYFYMSPEQAWGDPIDGRTDIFSTGILLYEMLVGEMLYYEEDIDRLLDVVRKADIQPPSSRRPGIPRELDQIVMKALSKRPRDRYATAAEMAYSLAHFLRGFAPQFSPSSVGTFVSDLLGEQQEPSVRVRNPRESTAELIDPDSIIDEHSLIFRLADLRGAPPKKPSTAVDVTPSVTPTTDPSDFADGQDATFVDGPFPTLGSLDDDNAPTATAPPKRRLGEPTRRAALPQREGPAPLPGVKNLAAKEVLLPEARGAPRPAPAPAPIAAPIPLRPPSKQHPITGEIPTTEWSFANPPGPIDPLIPPPPSPQPIGIAPLLSTPTALAPPPPAIAPPPPRPPDAGQGWPWAAPASSPLPGNPSDATSFSVPNDLRLGDRRSRRWWWLGFAIVVVALVAGLIAALVGPLPTSRGIISVVSLPAGATVKVDAHEVPGTTPLHIDDVDVKIPHKVSVSLGGYEVWEREVSFDWNRSDVGLQAVLSPLTGSLTIASIPAGADVIVNGRFRGQAPLTVEDLLTTQEVSVELRQRGYRVERRTLPWNGRRSLTLTLPLERAQ